jgi:hypothetical protein
MIEDLLQATASKKEVLQNHPIYQSVTNSKALKIFMEHHVWAVWDFMSLAKSLQLIFTTCRVPWIPPRRSDLARFINEIIPYEESDLDHNGKPASHFESYLFSMDAIGSPTNTIRNFIKDLELGKHWKIALEKSPLPRHPIVLFPKISR